MKKLPVLAIGTLASFLSAAAASAAAYTAVGVYDEQAVRANFVDFYVTTQTTTPTATSGAADPLDGYKTAFSTAFTSGFGGVVNFDLSDVSNQTSIEAAYGSNKILNIGVANGFRAVEFGTDTEISGTRSGIFLNNTGGDTTGGTFTFGSITNGLANEAVVQFGLTFLGRDITETITGFATYSNSTTSASLSRSISSGDTQDSFFGFTAPTGLSIASVTFSGTGTRGKTFDDFGFVTAVVPEPTSLGLLGVAGMALASRRRRQS
jgi:hypothetical protein